MSGPRQGSPRGRLRARLTTLREAKAFIAQHHRHHPKAPPGARAVLGVEKDGQLVGVATLGRPLARMEKRPALEVTRLATDGTPGACAFLYAKARIVAGAMGAEIVTTKTLPTEGGASLRGAGWRHVGRSSGGSWSREGRERTDPATIGPKDRWEVSC